MHWGALWLCAVSASAVAVSVIVEAQVHAQVPSDEEIDAMGPQELAVALTKFESSNVALADEVSQLRAGKVTARARLDQEKRYSEKVAGDRRWEEAKKEEEEAHLHQANAEFNEKQSTMGDLEVHVAELKAEVEQMTAKLYELKIDSNRDTKRLNDPSLLDVVGEDAQHWSAGARAVYNRTVADVLPAMQQVQEEVKEYRAHASRTTIRIASLAMYGFLVGSVLLMRNIIGVVGKRLTVARLIFLSDAYCASFWSFVSCVYLVIRRDPLVVTQEHNLALFFLVQVGALVLYVCYVLLRVAVLANSLTLTAFFELVGVIAVGQHYYVYIWLPSLAINGFSGSVYAYACYSWFFYAIGMTRISSFSSPEAGQMAPWWTPVGVWERVSDYARRGANRENEMESRGRSEEGGEWKLERGPVGVEAVEEVVAVVVPTAPY